jgi:hypothetical protein
MSVITNELIKHNYNDYIWNERLTSINKNAESWSIDKLKPFHGNSKEFLIQFTRCSQEESDLFDSLDDAFQLEEEYVEYLTRLTPIMNNGGPYYFQIMMWFICGLITEKRYQLLQQVPFRRTICRAWVLDLCVFQNVNKLGTVVTEKKCPSCEKMHSMFKQVVVLPSDLESEIDQIIQRKKPDLLKSIGTVKVIPGGFEINSDSMTRIVIRECSIKCDRKNCKNTHPEGWDFRNNIPCSFEKCYNSECIFKHEDNWTPVQNLIDHNDNYNNHCSSIPCNFGKKCNKKNTCPYKHPQVNSQVFIIEKPVKKTGKKKQSKRSVNTSYREVNKNI